MATDPRTIINTNEDPGLVNPTGYIPTQSATNGTNEVKTVIINYTDPPLYGVPELQIFNDPGGKNGAVQFNVGNRLGGDSNFNWNSKTRTLSILGNIRISDNIIGRYNTNTTNLRITGGQDGYVLSTDGTGNISWISAPGILYGNSNVANYLPTYTGNVSANYFIGNGSQLTGLPTQYANSNVANYLPTYTGNLNGGNLIITNTGYIYNISSTGLASLTTVNVSSNLTTNAIYTDNYFYANGNVVPIGGSDANTGNVTFNNINVIGTGNLKLQPDSANSESLDIYLTGTNDIHIAGSGNVILGTDEQANVAVLTNGNVAIQAGNVNGKQTWNFGTDGLLTLPSGNVAIGLQYGSEAILASNTSFGVATQGANVTTFINWSDDVANTSLVSALYVNAPSANAGDIHIRTGGIGNANIWQFNVDGNLVLPGNTFSVNYANGTQVSIGGGGNTGNVTFDDNIVIGTSNLKLQPDSANSSAYLDIYLTGGPDIHIAGNGETVILGTDEFANVTVNVDGNVSIQANAGTPYTWNFGTDGTTTLPTNISIDYSGGNALYPRIIAGSGKTFSVQAQGNTGSAALAWTVDPNAASQYASVGVAKLGDNLAKVVLLAQSDSGDVATSKIWQFDENGTTRFPGDIILAPASQSITMQSDQYSQLMWQNANANVAPNMATYSNFFVAQNSAVLDIGYLDGNSNPQFKEWLWGVDGTMTLPTAGRINFDNLSISSDANVSAFYAPSGNVQLAAGTGNAQIVANSLNDSKTWTFGTDGILTLPQGSQISETANTSVNITANANTWAFGVDGNLTVPGSLINDTSIVLSAPAVFNICTIATAGSGYDTGSSLKATTGGSGTGMTVGIGYGLSNQLTSVGVVNPGTGYVNGDVITVSEGTGGTFVISKYNESANQTNNNTVQTNLTFANNTLTLPTYGEIIAPGNITANNIGNITSINLDGNVSNVLTGNGTYVAIPTVPTVGNIATINLDGNVSNVLTGNGTFAAVPAPTVSQDITSNGAMSIMTYDGTIKYVNYATVEPSSGNIAGGNISANGNISGNNISATNISVSGNLTVDNTLVNRVYLLEAYASETYTLPGSFTEDTCRYSIVNNTVNVPSGWFNTSTYRFTPQKAGYWEITASYDVYRNSEASLAIKKNLDIVAAAGSFNAVAQQVTKIIYLNGSTDYINIINVGGAALSRAQYDSRSWFQARWVGA